MYRGTYTLRRKNSVKNKIRKNQQQEYPKSGKVKPKKARKENDRYSGDKTKTHIY